MPEQNEPGAGGHGVAPTRFAKAEFFSAKTLVILTTLRGPGCFFGGAMSQGGSGGGHTPATWVGIRLLLGVLPPVFSAAAGLFPVPLGTAAPGRSSFSQG